MSFYSETPIKAVRKARRCSACDVQIEVGEPALKCSGSYDGFWSGTYHLDCRNAECALNKRHGCSGGEDWLILSEHMEWDDWPWLIKKFPTVAARMNITIQRYLKIRDEHESRRLASIERARRDAAARATTPSDPVVQEKSE